MISGRKDFQNGDLERDVEALDVHPSEHCQKLVAEASEKHVKMEENKRDVFIFKNGQKKIVEEEKC